MKINFWQTKKYPKVSPNIYEIPVFLKNIIPLRLISVVIPQLTSVTRQNEASEGQIAESSCSNFSSAERDLGESQINGDDSVGDLKTV